MKKVNKLLAAGAVLAFAVMGSVFAEGDFTFENKISTDTVMLGDAADDNHRFPGVTEQMIVEYLGEKVDAKADIGIGLFGYNEGVDPNKETIIRLRGFYLGIDGGYYVKFRPIEMLQFALASGSEREYASGAYMSVLDEKLVSGLYTGMVGLLVKPIDGLSIGAGLDLDSYLVNTNDGAEKARLNFGAEYAVENIGSFGLAFTNVFNHFGFGAYAKLTAISGMDIYAGFSFKNDLGYNYISFGNIIGGTNYVSGKLILNAGLEYTGVDKLTLAADLGTNLFTQTESQYYDLYLGFKAAYDVNENLSVGGKANLFFDVVDENNDENRDYCYSPIISISPEVSYKTGNHKFTAGLKMEFWHTYSIWKDVERESRFGMCFPVSWSYSF